MSNPEELSIHKQPKESSDSDSEIEEITMVDFESTTVTQEKETQMTKTPLKTTQPSELNSGTAAESKTLTPKQLEKQREKEAKEKKRIEEKLAREKAKEEERKLKEEKRLQEKKAKEEEKERIKRENELKREKERQEREQKKNEERLRKEQERLKREEEKEKERLRKEEEKRKAEEEKRKKEEEAEKKKSKLKISNFFKPKTTVKSTTILTNETSEKKSDYSSMFYRFFIADGVSLHTSNTLTGESLKSSMNEFDSSLNSSPSTTDDLKSWFQQQASSASKPEPQQSAEYIYENEIISAPIRIKFIKFYENVKCWIGTYTNTTVALGLGKTPTKETPFFIDFDDEVGEDEEGEGEDIDDDDDASEGDEEDEEDLQDFLEEDNNSNGELRKKVVGPLMPLISWKGQNVGQEPIGLIVPVPVIKFEILNADVSLPVDPLKDYWSATVVAETTEPSTGPDISVEDQPKPKKTKSLITVPEDLELFASKVQGCDFTVPTMVEILKKELPKYTKGTIETTLKTLAKRVGPKMSEKRWEVDTQLLKSTAETQ